MDARRPVPEGSYREESAIAGSRGNVETRYDIKLVSAGTKPRRLAWTIASITGLRVRDAWELLRKAPVLILRGAYYGTAEGAREALERRGATVELRAYDVEAPQPKPSSLAPSKLGSKGWLVFVGVLAILIAAPIFAVRLVNRYSPEGRLRSYVPESIRETCDPETGGFLGGPTSVATESYPSAIAGLFYNWKPHSPEISNDDIHMTYLFFEDRETLIDVYPAHPTSCLTDERGRRICYDPDYFGRPPLTFGCPVCYGGLTDLYHEHIVWTDGTLLLTDATVMRAIYQ
jgi:ribosomal protein L7/L12